MADITDLAKTLLPGGLGPTDVNTLIKKAEVGGITEAERTEMTALLSLPGVGDKFTAAGKQTLQTFLASLPPLSGPPKSVSSLVPILTSVADYTLLDEKFKADYLRVEADLVGHPSLSASDKANRSYEFFTAYARYFVSKTSSLSEETKLKAAKGFTEVLSVLGFGAMVNADTDKDGVTAATELLIGDDPTAFTARANHKPWTTTYWPLSGDAADPVGNPGINLWARQGPLAKFDALLKARGQTQGALDYERQSNLNWLLADWKVMKGATHNVPSGHYVPASKLSEQNAEVTTGVDFNRNGKIDANVAWDFLDANQRFGTDGKTDGTLDIGWWGSCDPVALAGILFKQPVKDVTLNGVTFTPQDVKGLLTVIASSQMKGQKWAGDRYDKKPDVVRLKNGTTHTGYVETALNLYQDGAQRIGQDHVFITAGFPAEISMRVNGQVKTFKADELYTINREDKRDDAGLFHTTIRSWLKTGMPAVMDKDSGDHVWNYNFWKSDDKEQTDKPAWAPAVLHGVNGKVSGGKVTYVERQVTLSSGQVERYKYWLEEKNGKIVNSGWADTSTNPDFLWGPGFEATFTGANSRNPFVTPELVKEIYLKSIE